MTIRSVAEKLALHGNIRVMALQTVISQLGYGMFYVIWQPYILSTGASVVQLGIVQSVINLSTAAGLIVWGVLSDRFGRKPVTIFSNACRVSAIIALLVSGGFPFLLIFAFFVGFSSLFMQTNPARSAIISESVNGQRRATAFSVLFAISQITSTLTASAGGYLAVSAGYHLIFYVAAAGDIVGLILLIVYLRETLGEGSRVESSDLRMASRLEGYLMPERGLTALYAIMVVVGLGYSTGYSLFYGTLVDTYGLNPIQLGLLSTTFSLIWGGSSIPLGRLSDRVGRLPLLKASWAMAVAAVLGFLFFRSFEAFLLFSMVSALDTSLWLSAWMAYVAETASSERLSTVMGKLDSYARLSGIPAPWFAGLLYSSFGFSAPLLGQLIALGFSMVLLFSLKEDTGSRRSGA